MGFYDKFYDELSKGYDELYGDEQRAKYAFTKDWLESLKGGILDVGAGIGIINEYVKPSVLADHSIGMLKMASGTRICCDARFLPFKDGSFSNITCYTVLQDLIDKKKVVSELVRVANDKLIITILKRLKTRREMEKLFKPLKVIEYREEDKDHCFLLSK